MTAAGCVSKWFQVLVDSPCWQLLVATFLGEHCWQVVVLCHIPSRTLLALHWIVLITLLMHLSRFLGNIRQQLSMKVCYCCGCCVAQPGDWVHQLQELSPLQGLLSSVVTYTASHCTQQASCGRVVSAEVHAAVGAFIVLLLLWFWPFRLGCLLDDSYLLEHGWLLTFVRPRKYPDVSRALNETACLLGPTAMMIDHMLVSDSCFRSGPFIVECKGFIWWISYFIVEFMGFIWWIYN